MAAPNRRERAQRAYAEAFSEALRELKVPMPALCSVVKVDMSPDLRSVKVYVSLFGEGHARSEAGRSLRRARAFLQGEVGRRIGLRFTPNLTIETDRSIERLSEMPDLSTSPAPNGPGQGHGTGTETGHEGIPSEAGQADDDRESGSGSGSRDR